MYLNNPSTSLSIWSRSYLLCGYADIFKYIPNNWVTEVMQQLTFSFKRKE